MNRQWRVGSTCQEGKTKHHQMGGKVCLTTETQATSAGATREHSLYPSLLIELENLINKILTNRDLQFDLQMFPSFILVF